MNLSRRLKLAVALAAGIGLLALAGVAAGAHMASDGAKAKRASVTLLVWDQEVRGGQNASMKALNAAFQKKYPDIKINRVAKSFTDLQATLKLAASGPNPPDVVEANNGYSAMGPLVKANLLLSLNKYADEVRLAQPLLDRDPADEPVHGRREEVRHRQPLRPADDRRGRRRLLQQGEAAQARAEGADDVRGVRAGAREGEGRRARRRSSSATSTSGRASTSSRSCMLQNVSKTYARNFIFGTGGGKTNFQSKGTVAAATMLQNWANNGYFTERLRRARLRPVVAGVRQGHRRLPDQRQLADGRPEEGARQERRLLPAAAGEGQGAGDARRRGPAVGDQLEVEERRRRGDVPQLHHEQLVDAGRREQRPAHRRRRRR